MKLTSTAFAEQESIPKKHTCQGADVSPALSWSGAPDGTKSFALVADDPDAPDPEAPTRRCVHWVLCDLPADVASLEENVDPPPPGTVEGLNDWNETGYRGPCPSRGCHRYFFKLYALDVASLGLSRPTRSELEQAMEGHILARTELIGTYVKGD